MTDRRAALLVVGALVAGACIFAPFAAVAGPPDLTEPHQVLLSAGRALAAGAPAFQWYVAYQLTAGPAEPRRGARD